MNRSDLRHLHDFNVWANRRIFDAVSTAAEVREDRGEIFREPVAHIVSAEWIWMERLEGTSPIEIPAWVDDDDIASLRDHLRSIEERRQAFLEGLIETEIERDCEFNLLNGTNGCRRTWQLFLHVINHSTYHRGQLARLLREQGEVPPSTDMIFFDPEGVFELMA